MTAKNPYPKSVYAAAGAGELALEQLRKLPETATKLRDKVQVELQRIDLADVRSRVQTEVSQLRGRLDEARKKGTAEARFDTARFRDTAQTTVNELMDNAQRQLTVASRQLTEVYEDLAHRGEKVLGNGQTSGNGKASDNGKASASQGTVSKATVSKATSKKTAPRSTAKTPRSSRSTASRSTKGTGA